MAFMTDEELRAGIDLPDDVTLLDWAVKWLRRLSQELADTYNPMNQPDAGALRLVLDALEKRRDEC